MLPRHKTYFSFSCHRVAYKYSKLLFGCCIIPTPLCCVDTAFKLLFYLDDIILMTDFTLYSHGQVSDTIRVQSELEEHCWSKVLPMSPCRINTWGKGESRDTFMSVRMMRPAVAVWTPNERQGSDIHWQHAWVSHQASSQHFETYEC